MPQSILLPVARLIMGDVYDPNDRDADGNPLVIKNGPNAGQPRVDFFMGVAIQKTRGVTDWRQTEWGAPIFAEGAAAFPQQHLARGFAWKVEDGDSQEPNTRGHKICDREGARGHWVVRLGGGYAPRLFTREGNEYKQLPSGRETPAEARVLKLGHYVQCQVTVEGNRSQQRPGLYLNHSMVLHVGYGPEIIVGPRAADVFGAAPAALPPGASATPVGVRSMPVAAPPAVAPAPAPVAVAPHATILEPVLPPPVPAAAPAPARVMTAKAAGQTYEAFVAAGWSDQQLVQHGYMAP
jgi:hypothetical protein